jgi:asparagine synthase (glutamine-hydrolysing)
MYPQLDWAPRFLRARATFRGLATGGIDAYAASVAISSADLRAQLYTPTFRQRLGGFRARDVLAEAYDQAGVEDELARIQYTDIKTNLASGILTKVDRASMAHSLEVRVPLLDHHIVEWAAKLESSLKINGNRGKYVLEQAASAWLPPAVRARPKRGFSAPFAAWLRGPLRSNVDRLARESAVLEADIVEAAALRRIAGEHIRGKRDHARLLWALLVLEAVLRRRRG